MKIGHPADKPLPAPAVGAPAAQADAAKPAPAQATGAAGVDASATVALSSTASTLLSTGGASEFDTGKVSGIAGQIADGSFKVNHEAIADKLIANAQELLSKAQG
ncbi:MAG TPA: flagellar biosynthesis anti-sigma factor FlgM [Caldimonas sp.]|jgi:negative regulator of flagellin synthesis FlgM